MLACLGCFLSALPSLLNVTIYRKFRLISATQPRKNEEAAVVGLPQSMTSTTVRPWSALEPGFLPLSLLHGRNNSWMTMEEVKTQALKRKC